MSTSSVRRRKHFDDSLLLNDFIEQIEASPTKKLEVVLTNYGRKFGIADQTVKYHLEKFIKNNDLIYVGKSNNYGRKIVTLPKYSMKPKEDIEIGLGEKMAFEEFIKKSMEQLEQATNSSEPIIFDEKEETQEETQEKIQEKIQNQIEVQDKPQEIVDIKRESQDNVEHQESKDEKVSNYIIEGPIEVEFEDEEPTVIEEDKPEIESESSYVKPMSKEEMYKALSLDEKIEEFISRSNNMYDANVLLKQSDKEILSVMHETIQRNILYLKDLSDELGTVKNRELIKSLIDEREALLSENKELQKTLNILREKEDVANSQKINPQRVRELQQKLVSNTSIYLNSSSESIALNRKTFIKEFIENVSELVDYTLGYDKK